MSFSNYAGDYDRMAKLNPAYLANLDLFGSFLSSVYSSDEDVTVCDVGAGTGNFIELASRALPAARFTHIDSNPRMNELAKRKYDQAGISDRVELIEDYFQRVDLSGRSYDLVVCVHALYAMPPQSLVLRRIGEILKPEGKFFVISFGRQQSVVDWGWYIYRSLARTLGFRRAFTEVRKLKATTSENFNTSRGQRNGTYWKHSTEEFVSTLEDAGFVAEDVRRCYRGYSDLAICKKKERETPYADFAAEVSA